MLVPRHQQCMFFCITMILVTVITHWKWKNQHNNNYITSFKTTANLMDDIGEDNNDNSYITNEFRCNKIK